MRESGAGPVDNVSPERNVLGTWIEHIHACTVRHSRHAIASETRQIVNVDFDLYQATKFSFGLAHSDTLCMSLVHVISVSAPRVGTSLYVPSVIGDDRRARVRITYACAIFFSSSC